MMVPGARLGCIYSNSGDSCSRPHFCVPTLWWRYIGKPSWETPGKSTMPLAYKILPQTSNNVNYKPPPLPWVYSICDKKENYLGRPWKVYSFPFYLQIQDKYSNVLAYRLIEWVRFKKRLPYLPLRPNICRLPKLVVSEEERCKPLGKRWARFDLCTVYGHIHQQLCGYGSQVQRVWKRESKYDGKGFVLVFAPRWTGPFYHSIAGNFQASPIFTATLSPWNMASYTVPQRPPPSSLVMLNSPQLNCSILVALPRHPVWVFPFPWLRDVDCGGVGVKWFPSPDSNTMDKKQRRRVWSGLVRWMQFEINNVQGCLKGRNMNQVCS